MVQRIDVRHGLALAGGADAQQLLQPLGGMGGVQRDRPGLRSLGDPAEGVADRSTCQRRNSMSLNGSSSTPAGPAAGGAPLAADRRRRCWSRSGSYRSGRPRAARWPGAFGRQPVPPGARLPRLAHAGLCCETGTTRGRLGGQLDGISRFGKLRIAAITMSTAFRPPYCREDEMNQGFPAYRDFRFRCSPRARPCRSPAVFVIFRSPSSSTASARGSAAFF